MNALFSSTALIEACEANPESIGNLQISVLLQKRETADPAMRVRIDRVLKTAEVSG